MPVGTGGAEKHPRGGPDRRRATEAPAGRGVDQRSRPATGVGIPLDGPADLGRRDRWAKHHLGSRPHRADSERTGSGSGSGSGTAPWVAEVRLGAALTDTGAAVRFTGRRTWTNRAARRFPDVESIPIIAPGQLVPAYADGVSVNHTRVTQEHVAEILNLGLDYYAFTPNDPVDQSRLAGMGATDLIVDTLP